MLTPKVRYWEAYKEGKLISASLNVHHNIRKRRLGRKENQRPKNLVEPSHEGH